MVITSNAGVSVHQKSIFVARMSPRLTNISGLCLYVIGYVMRIFSSVIYFQISPITLTSLHGVQVDVVKDAKMSASIFSGVL